MASPTPNKGYTYPAHGGAVNAWDTPLNTNFDQIDLNVGGVYKLTYTSTASTVTYNSTFATFSSTVATLTLPAANAQNLNYIFASGSTRNITIVFPGNVGGLYNIWNNGSTTSTFTLTAQTSVATSSGVVIPNGYKMLVCADGTNLKQGDDSFVGSLIGTSGTKLTYADGNNTYSGNSSFTGTINHSGAETFTGTTTFSSNLSAVRISGSVVATSATQETATSSNTVVTPLVQQYHPSAAKAYVKFSGSTSPVISRSYNVSTVTATGTGRYVVTLTSAFSDSDYIIGVNAFSANASEIGVTAQSTNSFSIIVAGSGGSVKDSTAVYAWCFGDQ